MGKKPSLGGKSMERTTGNRKQLVSNGLLYIKRRHPRVEVQGFVGDVADGNFVLEGVIDDVSSGGFKMSNLPRNFSASNNNYTMVISGKGKHYRLIVVPCWKKTAADSHSLDVGFKIVQASWEWSEFILNEISPDSLNADFGYEA
jgi:hypothetical protein